LYAAGAELATRIEAIYAYARWGSGAKKRERKQLIAKLREQRLTAFARAV
jgi:hypothetical protein